MPFKKPLKISLFPIANILLAVFLLMAIFITGQNIVQTFQVAHMSALVSLKPEPKDYFWKFNDHQVPINKSRIRYYADYYEQLLQVFPSLWDAYGILGYCYHYLGDDAKAIDYLKKAVAYDPFYMWNYYNLAVIYVYQSRYQEASELFQKMRSLSPRISLQRMFKSQIIYAPLLGVGGQEAMKVTIQHLKLSYNISSDLIQLINQFSYNNELDGIIKKMKLDLYAF